MRKKLNNKKAFSLIELSIVILIVGIVIAGVTQASRLINAMRLSSARANSKLTCQFNSRFNDLA